MIKTAQQLLDALLKVKKEYGTLDVAVFVYNEGDTIELDELDVITRADLGVPLVDDENIHELHINAE